MKQRIQQALAVAMLVVALAWPGQAQAQTGGGYDLMWNSIGGGQMFSQGGDYQLGSTIGQPDAGRMTGGSYELNGGFWVPPIFQAYVPIVRKP